MARKVLEVEASSSLRRMWRFSLVSRQAVAGEIEVVVTEHEVRKAVSTEHQSRWRVEENPEGGQMEGEVREGRRRRRKWRSMAPTIPSEKVRGEWVGGGWGGVLPRPKNASTCSAAEAEAE